MQYISFSAIDNIYTRKSINSAVRKFANILSVLFFRRSFTSFFEPCKSYVNLLFLVQHSLFIYKMKKKIEAIPRNTVYFILKKYVDNLFSVNL
jgi:hypothetical protein